MSGCCGADAGAEQLHAGAGAGRFDDRRSKPGLVRCELLGHRRRERIDGRGADDLDLLARRLRRRLLAAGRERERGERRGESGSFFNAASIASR